MRTAKVCALRSVNMQLDRFIRMYVYIADMQGNKPKPQAISISLSNDKRYFGHLAILDYE